MVPAPILNVLENNLNVPITNMQRMIALLTLRNRTIVQAGKLAVAVHLSHSGSNTMWAVAGLVVNALPLSYVMAFRFVKPMIRRRRALHRALLTQLALIQAAPGGAHLTGMTLKQLEAATDACAAAKVAAAEAVAAAEGGGAAAVSEQELPGSYGADDDDAPAADSGAGAEPAGGTASAAAASNHPGSDIAALGSTLTKSYQKLVDSLTGAESATTTTAAPKPAPHGFWGRVRERALFWRPRTEHLDAAKRNEAALVYALLCARQFAAGDAAVVALYSTPNVGFNLRKCIVRFHGASRNVLMVRLIAKTQGGWGALRRDETLMVKAEGVARSITAQARLIPLLTGLDLLL